MTNENPEGYIDGLSAAHRRRIAQERIARCQEEAETLASVLEGLDLADTDEDTQAHSTAVRFLQTRQERRINEAAELEAQMEKAGADAPAP